MKHPANMNDGERLAVLETQMNNIENKVNDIDAKVDAGFKAIMAEFKCMDNKYAAKWVEKVLWGIGGVVGTTIILAVLSLILSK